MSTGGGTESLYIALKEYSQCFPFHMKKADEWFDIGHLDKYYDAQLAVKSRTFNHITIDRRRGMLTKSSDNREKLINEIKWYLKLPKDIEYIRPRIFDYSLSYDKPYVSMEYYAYHTLHELFLYGDLSEDVWIKIFKIVKFILKDMGRYVTSDFNVKKSLKAMYLEKTMNRMEAVREFESNLLDFEKTIVINNKRYISINRILDMLPALIRDRLLGIESFTIIHGDLCFANILIDSNFSFVKCIDPRGSFGNYDIYGDQRYELAKLLHSMDGKYDYIIKDLFVISVDNNRIDYHVIEDDKSCSVSRVFCSVFKEELEGKETEVKLIEALLFLSMIPLHKESRKRQLAMLATGVQLLAEVADITEGNYGRK